MNVNEIIWLDDVIEKLARKHAVGIDEVEQVFNNKPQFRFIERGNRVGEDVYMAYGQTEGGRYLSVLFIHKASGDALILSARDMAKWEKKRYERK